MGVGVMGLGFGRVGVREQGSICPQELPFVQSGVQGVKGLYGDEMRGLEGCCGLLTAKEALGTCPV